MKTTKWSTLFLCFCGATTAGLMAQDTRNVTEPITPKVCAVLRAPLKSAADGPVLGDTADEQNAESSRETTTLQTALLNCTKGQAVELTLGVNPSFNAFLLEPVTLPANVSLIIDGGVTVYGSRDPSRYQDNSDHAQGAICGTVGEYQVDRGCLPLFTLRTDNGIYGYGVIDGQGNRTILSGDNQGISWWDMAFKKKNSSNEQASPKIINAGVAGAFASNVVLHKITIRNPPFHTVGFGGNGFTVWGVKVQAPWTMPNSDGFDIHGSNITIYDTTVAIGDQDIAISTNNIDTSNITVRKFRGYNKGGITILAGGDSHLTSNLLFEELLFTGSLPSVVGTTVNGVTEATLMQPPYSLQSYAQALPTSTGDLKAMQITTNISSSTGSKPGNTISNVTFQSVCVQDIVRPINIVPLSPFKSTDNLPAIAGVVFRDVHVLPPTAQFPKTNKGVPVTPAAAGGYGFFLQADPSRNYYNDITLDNVVFDDVAQGQTSLAEITAIGTAFTTVNNVYPPILNNLNNQAAASAAGPTLNLDSNFYAKATSVSDPSLAYACPAKPPFVTGELYLTLGRTLPLGEPSSLPTATINAGGSVTLNAVVQPIMSQSTFFNPKGYNAQPGLLAVGSPALTNPVEFYEGDVLVGTAKLSANGTLATLAIRHLKPGTHVFTARYPADAYYDATAFGSVTVVVRDWPRSSPACGPSGEAGCPVPAQQ
ncbi:glycosyl hydrolase family 28 protein [Paludibaculum fermentans]|uniref:Ig-like domain repeat protein n=1 Tax=Paludibaculum fermentans TaxID=1473598 RepID=A0A7S7SIA1_PALFE|nr:glycosyl hydrolase family 28 protein [Paludibaculum fermentans]QOY85854.1 Ig-like domain repeat protein [Paludibaculum fermentans]